MPNPDEFFTVSKQRFEFEFEFEFESKPKAIVFSPHVFSRAWRQLHVFASNSDWLVMLFRSFAVGQRNYFGYGFTTLNCFRQNLPTNIAVCGFLFIFVTRKAAKV